MRRKPERAPGRAKARDRQELAKQLARLARAQRLARLGHWEWDLVEQRLTWSDELYELFDWPRDQPFTFAGIAGRVHPEDRARNQAFVDRLLGGAGPGEIVFRVLTPAGRLTNIQQFAEVVRTDDGRPRLVAGTMQDVTALRVAETALSASEARLTESDRLATMGMLGAGIAHEINNPLAILVADLDAIVDASAQGRPPSAAAFAEIRERATEAVEYALRIRDLVRGLASFSRVDRSELGPVDVNELCRQALGMAHNEIKYRARPVAELTEVPPVLGAEGRLGQVLLNLLLNAAQAVPEGAATAHRVAIRTRSEGASVVIEVEDNGRGIPAAELPFAFDPTTATGEPKSGAGWRLPICRTIVGELGGTITVASALERGSTFTVRLPAARPAPLPPAPRAPDLPAGVRGRILVADDEPGMRALLCRILGAEHEVVAVESGLVAQQVLGADQAFDLLLVDVMMPEVSGAALHRWLAAHHPALAARVVFITGGAFGAEVTTYLDQVDNLRVDKPFNRDALKQLVRERVSAARR